MAELRARVQTRRNAGQPAGPPARAHEQERRPAAPAGAVDVPAASWEKVHPALRAIHEIQRAAGNQAAQRLLLPKLAVSRPGDPLERAADRVADAVLHTPDPARIGPPAPATPAVQRLCAGCDEDRQQEEERKEDEEERVQAKAAALPPPAAPPSLPSHLERLRGQGRPLEPQIRSFFESRFGQDFSHVRVHAGAAADEASRAIGALAFTVGSDVVFRAGQYAPESGAGRRLLAHELTHTIQQAGGAPALIQRREAGSGGDAAPGTAQHQTAGGTTEPTAAARVLGTPENRGLLINNATVRGCMWGAYRQSRIGGFVPCEDLPATVSEATRRRCREQREQGRRPEQRECGAKILQNPDGSITCSQIFCGRRTSLLVRPPELNIRGNRIGEATIVGSFHTHPVPPPSGVEEPSPGDVNIMGTPQGREAQGREHYVIGLYNVYVVFPDRPWRIVGRTGDLLFGGVQPVRPRPPEARGE